MAGEKYWKISRGYGHHEWPKAMSDKSNIFTSNDHNHK